MKIGIDARMFGPRVGGGGLGRYVAELVSHIQKIDHTNEYVLFLKKENFHECVITNPRFRKQLVDVHWYTWQEQIVMPKEVRRARVDFMHYPHWNVPLFSRVPFLVTIHDLILLQDPTSARTTTRSSLVHGFKYAGFRTVLEKAVHGSRQIVTVSEYTKTSILRHFGVRRQKIHVIPNGIMPARSTKNVSLHRLGVYNPFFLYVGNAYPHKNLTMLMHAFSQFPHKQKHVQFVIAGRRDIFSKRLEREAQELGLTAEHLRFIDLPTDEEIAALYQAAALFIFPSKIEGFGMPPLEAMSYGTPVAAAHTSSLPEVLGQAAQYFAPDDIERLVEIMLAAVDHESATRTFAKQGIAQAARFSWQATAEKTLALYQKM